MTPAVELRGVRKSFAGTLAVDRVSLDVRPGQIHGLLGPNGSGKTTTLAILLGLLRPDAGSIRLLGQPLRFGAGLPAGAAGFVDSPRFPPYLTARAVLAMVSEYDGPRNPAREDELLALVGLAGAADTRTGGFSLGMRQRLALAAALVRRPRLLILDEPANGLDPRGQQDLAALLRDLTGSGCAVLISSHSITLLAALCDAVTILTAGRVAFSGTVPSLEAQAPAPSYRLRTTDDPAVLALARQLPGAVVVRDSDGLRVRAEQPVCDQLVMASGCAGVAVRNLSVETTALEAMFFQLTGRAD